MNNKHKQTNTSQACGEQVASDGSESTPYRQIKLALDVHAGSIVVVRMIDVAKPLVQKWKHILLNPKAHRRARKRAILAFARQWLVDLWRWKTHRMSPEQLGWSMTAG